MDLQTINIGTSPNDGTGHTLRDGGQIINANFQIVKNEAEPLYGNGSPEGSVAAKPGRTYWDRVAKALWIKDTGESTTGWQVLIS
jgi:hypothetical protein